MNKQVCMNCLHRHDPDNCSAEWIDHKGYSVGPHKNHTCERFEYTKAGLWEAMKSDIQGSR